MTTLSKPVIYDSAAITAGDIDADDTNINGAQWSRLLRFAGTGTYSGMNLTLSAIADTGTISTGWGIWNGYTCEVTVTETVSLPPVVAAKTYSIGVLYDPANLSTEAGPLSIAVYDKADISLPSGGLFWTAYEVDRTAPQSLSASVTRNYRVVPSTTIYVANGVSLPPPAQYSYGTIAVASNGKIYRRLSTPIQDWYEVSDDTGDRTDGFAAAQAFVPQSVVWRKRNGMVDLNLNLKRTIASFSSSAGAGYITDLPMLTVPVEARPRRARNGEGKAFLPNASGNIGFTWRLNAAGVLTIDSANPGITFTVGTIFEISDTFIQ